MEDVKTKITPAIKNNPKLIILIPKFNTFFQKLIAKFSSQFIIAALAMHTNTEHNDVDAIT